MQIRFLKADSEKYLVIFIMIYLFIQISIFCVRHSSIANYHVSDFILARNLLMPRLEIEFLGLETFCDSFCCTLFYCPNFSFFLVGYFLHNGVSPNLQNEDGLSALHQVR